MSSSLLLPAVVMGVFLASACGGEDEPVVRAPESSSATSDASGPQSPATSDSDTGTPTRHPKVTVEPATRLRDGQSVTVSASGFSPGLTLVVVECADKGQATGPGDCNLDASTMVHTDDAGKATTQLPVSRGPFGANGVVCDAQQQCLVSVTEASFTPTEEADAPISFG